MTANLTTKPDVTLESHPDHHVVGKEFLGHDGGRYLCESHDSSGYWLYNTDGSGNWKNVSERAIGRTFREIYDVEDNINGGMKKSCGGYGKIPSYVKEKS